LDGKIGIITHFYRSTNYGGNLQAYALCKYLNGQYCAEQIQYKRNAGPIVRRVARSIYQSIKSIPIRMKHASVYEWIDQRKRVFEVFKDAEIPHSKVIYRNHQLKDLSLAYQVFITGSDQVWHPSAVCDAYLLSLGVTGVNKIAYAASVAKDELTAEQESRYRNAFADYKAISVREESAVPMIQKLSPVKVQWAVDPVFLLSREQWNTVVGSEKERKKYAFCYFLGDSYEQRRLAKEYASELSLEIVTIPYLNNQYRECDDGFGDELIYCADPFEFVRLIRDADVVLTDSFHAMAFSLIFHKQFFVFERKAAATMSSRILSMANMFGVTDRFCNEEAKLKKDWLLASLPVDYSRPTNEFETLRNDSIRFLKENIDACLGDKKV